MKFYALLLSLALVNVWMYGLMQNWGAFVAWIANVTLIVWLMAKEWEGGKG